jgi:hypothetical protein
VNLSIWRSVRGADRSRNRVANHWAFHPIPSQKASKPLWHKHFPVRIGAIANRIISSFARLGGFVIRSPLRTLSALFLGSSAVEHSTVNRMVAGSNPARGAKIRAKIRPSPFGYLAQPKRRDQLSSSREHRAAGVAGIGGAPAEAALITLT